MATTIISDGQIKRRTKLISQTQAAAFARLLERNPRQSVAGIAVVPDGKRARVEYIPTCANTVYKLFAELQIAREQRAVEQVRHYRWRRFGRKAWTCRGPQGQQYSVVLEKVGNEPAYCTCPDWPRISSVGGKCKHFICAEEAEARFQNDILKREQGNASVIVPDPDDPYKD